MARRCHGSPGDQGGLTCMEWLRERHRWRDWAPAIVCRVIADISRHCLDGEQELARGDELQLLLAPSHQHWPGRGALTRGLAIRLRLFCW